ncbi:MAG: hydrogenase maturation protease [Acidimicrobiia bacterium]
MRPRIVLIGVGNEMRRDDGVGLAVVRAVTEDLDRSIESVILDGEPTRMIDAWESFDVAVVVDAVRTGAAPGTVHRYDVSGGDRLPGRVDQASSHALGIGESIALGRALDRLPGRVVVVGVEGSEFGDGPGLSAPVAAAVAGAAAAVRSELTALAGDVR